MSPAPVMTVRDVISPAQFLAWQIFGYTVFAIAGVVVITALVQVLRAAAGMKPLARIRKAPAFQMSVVIKHGNESVAFPATVGRQGKRVAL